MSRKIALFCALIGLVAFVACPAYAEVQNIKVSGDIQALGVYRDNYDLEDASPANPRGIGLGELTNAGTEDSDSLFLSVVRLRVDADLTDNVSACVRLANLREWDVAGAASDDIILDLAYVTLKEMLYSPLTMVIGRQELSYGNGLVVGMGLYQDPTGVNTYNDLSPLHGYDAVRAVLDYDPWTMDLVMAKINESDDDAERTALGVTINDSPGKDSDTDLYGVNLGYRFAQYDAEMEGYFFAKRDENWNYTVDTVNAAGDASYRRRYEENDVYTIGLRGSLVPADNFTLAAEIAGQFGKIRDDGEATAAGAVVGTDIGGDTSLSQTRDREALAANVAGEYTFANARFTPSLGVEYLYLSGEEAGQNGDYEEWDTMYRGKRMSIIRDMLENLYRTNDNLDTSGWTNQHTLKVAGGLDLGELVDGLSLDLAYLHYWFVEEPLPGANDDIGDEINLTLTYDYTEDVQFALDGAWFMPGDYYDRVATGTGEKGRRGNTAAIFGAAAPTNRPSNDTAVSIVGSCKVTF